MAPCPHNPLSLTCLITTTLCPQHTLSPRCSNSGILRPHGTLLGTALHPQHTLSPWCPIPVAPCPRGTLSPRRSVPGVPRHHDAPSPALSPSCPHDAPSSHPSAPVTPRHVRPHGSAAGAGSGSSPVPAGGGRALLPSTCCYFYSLCGRIRCCAELQPPRHRGTGTGTGTARGRARHGVPTVLSRRRAGAMCATRVPGRCPRVPGPVRPPRATLQVPPAGDGAWARARAARADPGGLRVPALPQRREGRGPGHPLTRRLRGWEKREQQRDGAREPVAITTPVPGWGRCSEPGTGTPGTGPARAHGDRGPLTLSPDFGLREDTGLCWCLSLMCPQPGGRCAVPQGRVCHPEAGFVTRSPALSHRAKICHAAPRFVTQRWTLSPRAGLCHPEPRFVTQSQNLSPRAGLRRVLPSFAAWCRAGGRLVHGSVPLG